MRYIKTVNLWDPAIHEALEQGNLKLQNGQWIYAGRKDHKSRYVGINPESKTIYAAHWQGSGAATLDRYNTLRAAVKDRI